MKWNASLAGTLSLLLAACGGGRPNYDYGLNAAPPPRGSAAAQTWGPPAAAPPGQRAPMPQTRSGAPYDAQDLDSETWRAADGTLRTRERSASVRAQAPYRPGPQIQPIPQSQAPAPVAPVTPPQAQPQRPGATYAPPGTVVAPPRPEPQPLSAPQSYPQSAPLPDPADPTVGMTGPRGSSRPGAGEQRYDEIGYAGVRGVAPGDNPDQAAVAIHRSVPVNTVLEVTSLDTGRTILVLVTGAMQSVDHPMDLSAGAAAQLGAAPGARIPVRIRSVIATPQDMLLLRSGRPAPQRPDAPAVLLNALRKRLSMTPAPEVSRPPVNSTLARPIAPPPIAATPRPPTPRPAATGRYFVQVAALSNARNAQSLARRLGGFVKQGGGLYRVQLGPFATSGEAGRARAEAARAGYGDARVFTN